MLRSEQWEHQIDKSLPHSGRPHFQRLTRSAATPRIGCGHSSTRSSLPVGPQVWQIERCVPPATARLRLGAFPVLPSNPNLDIILTRSRRLAEHVEDAHDGPMEQLRGEAFSRRRGMHDAFVGKRAAGAYALALLSAIRELMATGFVSQRGLANELNRKKILVAVVVGGIAPL